MRERVALVTPAAARRQSAEAWGPLLADRAELQLVDAPAEELCGADLVVLDEACPDLEVWRARLGHPDAVVVFGASDAPGTVPWGREGTPVLATISDFLDRRSLLQESDAFLEELRSSTERLDDHRRRFSRLVLEQAESLRGANASLAREVDQLTRLQALARFFASPGPEEGVGERMMEAIAIALGATGAALARRAEDGWSVEDAWRISRRNARGIVPEGSAGSAPRPRPSSRKSHDGWWIPVDADAGLAVLVRSGERPGGEAAEGFLETLCSLVADGLASRAGTEELLLRKTQSERILDTLRGGLLRIDGTQRIVLANPAFSEILDVPAEELEGRTVARAFARDPHLVDLLGSALSGGGTADDVETHVTTSRGRRVSVSVRASTLPEAEGGGLLVLLSDLSRRKEVEEEIRRADRLAALGRLSAGVAHEIRNPLAGIRTTAEILRSRLDDEAGRFVDVILEETARLDRIVGSLLQFAKPSRPRLEPVPIPELLERVHRLAASRAAERGVSIRRAPAENLPTPLADRDQILQVLLNVFLNGVEATPDGGEVRVEATSGAGGREVRVEVEDGGAGVPPAIRERIFDPFFTTKPGGTGLGLSISQNILRQHGGSLRIESEREGHTRAIVTLPLHANDSPTGEGTWPTS